MGMVPLAMAAIEGEGEMKASRLAAM